MGTYQDALAEWGAHADAALLAEQQLVGEWTARATLAEVQLADTIAELESVKGDLRKTRARVRRLLAIIAELEGTPPPASTVFGSSCGRHTYDYFTQMAGSPLAARRSYETGPRSSIVGSSVAADVGRCISVNSMAFNPNSIATNGAKVEAFLRSFPTDHPLYFIVSHEPENPSKGYVPAEFVAQQVAVREIVNRVNADREVPISFGGNFMAWSADSRSGRDMGKWTPPTGTWDFLAWDGYSAAPDGGPIYYEPAATFGAGLKFCRDRDLPFAIAECGIHVDMPVDDRIRWIDSCQQWAADQDATFWMYWDGSFSVFWLNTGDEFRAVVEGPAS